MEQPRVIKIDDMGKLKPKRPLIHNLACAYVEDRFRHVGGVEPTWVIAAATRVFWLETAWEDEHEKAMIVRMIRCLLSLMKAEAYAVISEAYVSTILNDDPEIKRLMVERARSEGLGTLPKEFRDDVVFIASEGRSKKWRKHALSRYLVTERPRGLGLDFLGPRQDEEGFVHTEGRLIDLLTPDKADDARIGALIMAAGGVEGFINAAFRREAVDRWEGKAR